MTNHLSSDTSHPIVTLQSRVSFTMQYTSDIVTRVTVLQPVQEINVKESAVQQWVQHVRLLAATLDVSQGKCLLPWQVVPSGSHPPPLQPPHYTLNCSNYA